MRGGELLKQIAGLIVKTAPIWGLAFNAMIAVVVAKETISGKPCVKSVLIIVIYAIVLGLLTFYAVSP